MVIADLAIIKTNFPEADFWLIRRGDLKKVGMPTKEFSEYHIGFKVTATDILLPEYAYWRMYWHWQSGCFQYIAHGSLNLKHIRVSDLRRTVF